MTAAKGVLLVVAALMFTGSATRSGASMTDSCMVRRILQVKIPRGTAVTYQTTFVNLGMTEEKILAADDNLLSFAMGGKIAHARNMQSCIGRRNPLCHADVCAMGGHCVLDMTASSYVCRCSSGRTGKFCEQDLNECSSQPCRNGATCHNGQNHFNCSCPLGFEGELCQTQWLKKQTHKDLPQRVAGLNNAVSTMTDTLKYLPRGCSFRTLGYNYRSIHLAGRKNQNSGQLDVMHFVKKRDVSVLRISYSTNIRTLGAQTAARWFVKIDGQECSQPSKIDIGMYRSSGDNTHIPAMLVGICEATPTGRIGRGRHTITIHIGQLTTHGTANAMTHWDTTTLFEIQEMCPQF